MLGKLIKYEFRSMSKVLYIIWIVIPLASILYGITIHFSLNSDYTDRVMPVIMTVSSIVYATLFIAMAIVTLVIIVARFYRGVLGTEGYLVNTLPVKSWQIITSKGLVSTVVTLIGCVISVAAIFIIVMIVMPIDEYFARIQYLLEGTFSSPEATTYILEMGALTFFSVIAVIYQIYTSLSIGQLVTKNRILMALLAYFLINIASTILNSLVASLVIAVGRTSIAESVAALNPLTFGLLGMLFSTVDGLENMSGYFIWSIAMLIVKIVVFHVVTNYILKNKLNLE